MEVKFADTFFKSLERMSNRERWYWKTWDFLRYDLHNGIKNIFFFWKVIWRYRSWDSSFQMRILARSLEPLSHTLEKYGNEVEEPRLKKVAKIRRAIEILKRQADDNYIELAEETLKYEVDLTYSIFGDKSEDLCPDSIKKMNSKIYDLSSELEEKEWQELWTIFKGQEHSHYVMLADKAKSENADLASEDLWNKWFDGSGMKGWWD